MKTYTRKIVGAMWSMGMPTTDDRFANVYRAALKAGLNEAQAFALTKEAFYAAKGYEWELASGTPLKLATQQREAEAHPEGKCAEDLLALKEGRPSRWGTPEFHRA